MGFSVHRLTISAFFLLAGLATLLSTSTLMATTHLVQFGGSFGFKYSPTSLFVSVGDTIRWQGDFGFHPLRSTTIPASAQSWSNSTGTVFSYVVQISGTYLYQCDNHGPDMSGSFTATSATAVDDKASQTQPSTYQLEQNYPNPFNPSTRIAYRLAGNAQLKLTVHNTLGQEVATLVSGNQEAGYHEVQFDGSKLASGVYLYRMVAGGYVETKKLLLVR
jgi:plastocyanin